MGPERLRQAGGGCWSERREPGKERGRGSGEGGGEGSEQGKLLGTDKAAQQRQGLKPRGRGGVRPGTRKAGQGTEG